MVSCCHTCAIPYENKANGCDTPSAILSPKGIARYGGGISHWAAKFVCQKHSRRLWRSQRRKSRSAPEGGADFPAAISPAGKCPKLGRDSISCCRKIGAEFSRIVEAPPARSFGQPRPSRVFRKIRALRGRVGWASPFPVACPTSCRFGTTVVPIRCPCAFVCTTPSIPPSPIPCTHFEIPSEDFLGARKSRFRYRFVIHAEIPGSGIRN